MQSQAQRKKPTAGQRQRQPLLRTFKTPEAQKTTNIEEQVFNHDQNAAGKVSQENVDPAERDQKVTASSHLPCSCMQSKNSLSYSVDRPFFNDNANSIKLQDHVAQLLKKLSDKERANIIEQPTLKFLNVDGVKQNDQDTIMLASYPRSGNTLLRAYIEKIMGLATGSESSLNGFLNKQLMDLGFVGEGLFDKRIQVVKTHYPERFGEHRFLADKCILEVRNPLDCIASLFNMVATTTHTHSVDSTDYFKFFDEWTDFIEQEVTVWKDFHDFWLNTKIPVHVIRFEDILERPRQCLTSLFKFILGDTELEGTLMERYIELATLDKAPEIYKPRVGKANANLDKYNKDHLEFIYDYCRELLCNFNYDDVFTKNKPFYGFQYINEFNLDSLVQSVIMNKTQKEMSILINYNLMSCRKENMLHPFGRKTQRFSSILEDKVNVADDPREHLRKEMMAKRRAEMEKHQKEIADKKAAGEVVSAGCADHSHNHDEDHKHEKDEDKTDKPQDPKEIEKVQPKPEIKEAPKKKEEHNGHNCCEEHIKQYVLLNRQQMEYKLQQQELKKKLKQQQLEQLAQSNVTNQQENDVSNKEQNKNSSKSQLF